jgi:hypothetical protein
MRDIESLGTQTPYFEEQIAPEAYEAEQAGPSVMDRVRGTWIGKTFAAFAVTAGLAAVYDAAPASAAVNNQLRPGNIAGATKSMMIGKYGFAYSMNLKHENLTAHDYNVTGFCKGKDDTNDLYLNFNPATSVVPISNVYPVSLRNVDFTYILDSEGNKVASDVNVGAAQHGNAYDIKVQNTPSKKTSQAEVFYRKGTSGGKQLKEVMTKLVKGKLSVKKLWY